MPDSFKRESSPACGRLAVMEHMTDEMWAATKQNPDNFQGEVSINFPAMPDTIDLVRRANYFVSGPPGFPDGIHVYQGTSVLEIPVAFKLHALDETYCPHGPKTLLEVAASLHALTLPFGPEGAPAFWGTAAQNGEQKAGDQPAVLSDSSGSTIVGYREPKGMLPPATCFLELIVTDRNSVGIVCMGYVKEARVRLHGPFMQGPAVSRNLPTMGEFDFVFVHHPGHSNATWNVNLGMASGFSQHAYAKVVQRKLYNTINMLTNPPPNALTPDESYHGFAQ